MLEKLLHTYIYICGAHKVIAPLKFMLENAFFLCRLKGGDRFVNWPHKLSLTCTTVHSGMNFQMQRDREDSLVLGPPTWIWRAWFPLPCHAPEPSCASRGPFLAKGRSSCPSAYPMPWFLVSLWSFSEFLQFHHLMVELGCCPGGSFIEGAVADLRWETMTSFLQSATRRFSPGFAFARWLFVGSSIACVEARLAFLIHWGVASWPTAPTAHVWLTRWYRWPHVCNLSFHINNTSDVQCLCLLVMIFFFFISNA